MNRRYRRRTRVCKSRSRWALKFLHFGSFPPLAIVRNRKNVYLHWTVDPAIHAYETQQKEINSKRNEEMKERKIVEQKAHQDLLKAVLEDIRGNIPGSQKNSQRSRSWYALMFQAWEPVISYLPPNVDRKPVQKIQIELLRVLDSEERHIRKQLTKAAKDENNRQIFRWSQKDREIIELIDDIADRVAYTLITPMMYEEPFSQFRLRVLIVPLEWRVPERVIWNLQQHILAQYWRCHNVFMGNEDLIHKNTYPRAGSTSRLKPASNSFRVPLIGQS